MNDVDLKLILDDSSVVAGLSNIEDSLTGIAEAAEDSQKALDDAFEKGSKDVDEFNDNIKKSEAALKRNNKELVATNRQNSLYQRVLQKTNGVLSRTRNAISGIVTGLKNKVSALRETKTGVDGTSKGIGLFGTAMKALPILAIIGALKGLIGILTRSQKGFEFVERTVAQVSAAVNVFADRIIGLGLALIQVFEGDFEGAAASATAAVSGIGDELEREIRLSGILSDNLRQIEKDQASLTALRAKSRAEIKELNKLGEDTTKGTEQRRIALARATALEDELLIKRQNNTKALIANTLGLEQFDEKAQQVIDTLVAGQDVDSVIDSLGLSSSNINDLEDFSSLVAEFYDGQAESAELQTTLQNKLNTLTQQGIQKAIALRQAEAAELKRINDEYAAIIGQIQQAANQADLEALAPIERIQKERDIAIAGINLLSDEAEAAAVRAGKSLDISGEIATLIAQVNTAYNKALSELRPDNGDTPELLPSKQILVESEQTAKTVGNIAVIAVADGVEEQRPTLDKIKEKILKAFGITIPEAAALSAAFSEVFSSITASIQASTQAQIDAQDAVVAQLEGRVDRTKEALDRELELKKAGLANDFDITKAQLAQDIAAQEEAEKKATKLREKAAKQKAKIDSITQTSSLITSSANIIQGFSAIPIVGTILGIAAVGTMLAFFAKAKIDAAKAANVPTFGGGGNLGEFFSGEVKGGSHASGNDIPAYAVGAGKGIKVEGKEWIVNGKDSQEQNSFLGNLNDGKYRGIDLERIADNALHPSIERSNDNIRSSRQAISKLSLQQKSDVLAEVFKEEIRGLAETMVKTMEERPVVYPIGGHKETFKKGNTKVKRTVSSKKV